MTPSHADHAPDAPVAPGNAPPRDADHHAQRLLAIVPAYNEADAIARVVNELHTAHPGIDILVVDDGSRDNTAAQVPAFAHLVRLPFNLGIGGAVQTGYRFALTHGYDLAVQVDGDGQHPADQIDRLLECRHRTQADLVIGSRFLEPGAYQQEPGRRAGIHLLNTLIRLLTGRRITDCTSGFRLASRRMIQAFAHWYPDDYPEPEVALLAIRAGFGVHETAVHMRHRTTGASSIRFRAGVFYLLKVSAALLLDMIRQPWPDKLRPK